MSHPALFQTSKALLAGCALLAFATVRAAEPSPENAKATKLANTVFLDAVGVKNLRLETAEIEEQVFEETVFALGRIEIRPGFNAVLSSRIAGRAVEVHALPDHSVQKGDPLVVVESRQSGNPPPQITLAAPISGLITEVSVALGEPISPDRSLLQIVNLESVYGIARVPENLAAQLLPGLTARIRVPGWKGEEWMAQIEHIGALADRASGTLEAAFLIDNPELRLRPGMRAEFSIVTARREDVMSVPRRALQGDAANRFVYVADDSVPHAFQRVPVQVGAMNDRYVEIIQGLFPGDQVVTEGAYSLAFAGKGSVSLKEALDAAHGHEHNPDGSEMTAEQKSAGGHDHDHDHDHTTSFSGLTLFSLIGNVILLGLLVVATMRRRSSIEKQPDSGSA